MRTTNATLSASGATSYSWSNGANSNMVVVSPSVNTNYIVYGADTNGCKNSATINQFVISCVGLPENRGSLRSVSIFPNPHATTLHIITNDQNLKSVFIFSATGAVLRNFEMNEKTELNVSDFVPGVYFIKVGNVTKKLIKL